MAAPSARGLASSSRFVAARHLLPPLPGNSERWIAALNRAVAAGGYRLIFPAGDAELLALSAMRSSVRASFPYPRHASVTRAVDKLALLDAAAEAGISVPATVALTGDQLPRWSFPAVVKARLHHASTKPGGPGRLEASRVSSPEEAAAAADRIRQSGGEPLLQELVGGRLMAVATVTDHSGSCVASTTQIATRTWPLAAGVSTRAWTIADDPSLSERIQRLLRSLGWTGLAQLQFLATPDADPCLIDFNARFYGSIGLAVAAGQNLPAIWAATAVGEKVTPSRSQVGVRYQWLEGDLRAAAAGGRGVRRRVIESLRFSRGATHAIWESRDPAPTVASSGRFLSRTARYLRLAFGRSPR